MKRKLLAWVLPPVGFILILLLRLSCRIRIDASKDLSSSPFIVAFWHGELLFQPFLYRKIRGSHPIAVMISEHFDGEIIARIIAFFGFETVRGSGRKNGVKALLAAIKKLESGYDIAITPDGPKGPRHSVADGIVAMAQKKSVPVVAFHIEASRYWRLKSWDGFIIPKPFSSITLYAGEPFLLDGMEMDAAKALVHERLCGNA